mgnify:CR=1 FL=1|jgi:hypothetical protein
MTQTDWVVPFLCGGKARPISCFLTSRFDCLCLDSVAEQLLIPLESHQRSEHTFAAPENVIRCSPVRDLHLPWVRATSSIGTPGPGARGIRVHPSPVISRVHQIQIRLDNPCLKSPCHVVYGLQKLCTRIAWYRFWMGGPSVEVAPYYHAFFVRG